MTAPSDALAAMPLLTSAALFLSSPLLYPAQLTHPTPRHASASAPHTAPARSVGRVVSAPEEALAARAARSSAPGAQATTHHAAPPRLAERRVGGLLVTTSPVTRAAWQAHMHTAPSGAPGCDGSCPVEQVSWFEAVAFANRASDTRGLSRCYVMEGCAGTAGAGCDEQDGASVDPFTCASVRRVASCTGYRLPGADEWASLAANTPRVALLGRTRGLTSSRAVEPAVRREAENGLRAMLGQVWQWTDVEEVRRGAAKKVAVRGGSWVNRAAVFRRGGAAFQASLAPDEQFSSVGFRLVRAASPAQVLLASGARRSTSSTN